MSITIRARKLVYGLLDLMPSVHQRASLKALLVLFLCAQDLALPEHNEHESPSALSRFLNLYDWPTTSVIRTLRREILTVVLERRKVGRRPILRARRQGSCHTGQDRRRKSAEFGQKRNFRSADHPIRSPRQAFHQIRRLHTELTVDEVPTPST
ncbi:hypothetical protein BH20ACT11_BH20ACT11_04880 [soil metagenome]